MQTERIQRLLNAAAEHVELFDEKTIQFLDGMRDRLDQWGDDLRVSDKQAKWLKGCEAELVKRGVDLEEFQ